MNKKHYFKINEDFASRSLARLYGLKEEKPGIWSIVEHSVTSSEHRSNIRSAERAFTKIKITEAQDLAEVLPPVAAAAAAVARQQAVAKGAMQSIGGATASNAFMSAADRLGAGQTGETNLSNIQAPESLEQGNAPKKLKKDVRGAKFRKQSKQQSVEEGDNSNLTKVMIPKVGQRVIADVSGYGRFGLYGTEPGVIVRIPSPRLIKVRIDKDGEIYDFDNNELYQRGLTDSKLNELDLFAPRITYIKIHNGQWVKAKYRATQTLGTEGDNPTFVDFSYVSDDTANRMGLNQRLKAGTTGRRPAGKITIANPGPTQQTGPFGPTNIDLIDLSNPDFNADEKLLSQLNQWLEKTPSLNKNKGVAEDSGKIFTVVYYSKKTDRNVTKQIKASSESELWDRLRAKGIDVVSVKEQGVTEGSEKAHGWKIGKMYRGSNEPFEVVYVDATDENTALAKAHHSLKPNHMQILTVLRKPQGVVEGLTKQAKARKEAEAVMTVIKRLEAALKDSNPHLDKADIQRRLDNEKRRLELYRDVLDEQGVTEARNPEDFMNQLRGLGRRLPSQSTLDKVFNEYDYDRVGDNLWKALDRGDEKNTLRFINSYLDQGSAQAWWGDLQAIGVEIDLDDPEQSIFTWNKPLPTDDQQDVAEGGPFSYGAKKPRKGSIADLAAKKRQEQERGRLPIEPRDQMVGTAKVTKDVKEDRTKFAGEKVGQKPGDQVRGTERAKSSKKQHPFKGRLVGDGA